MQRLGFCLVMMLGFLIEATLGFGGTVAALPLCSMIVGIHTAIPAITIIVCIASLVIVIQDRAYIAYKPYFIMMILMLAGMPLGMMAYAYLPERPLKILLGVFTVLVAVKGLSRTNIGIKLPEQEKVAFRYYICLLLAGVVHGAFSSGGVLAVMYANRAIREKRAYRVTLSAIWFSLNLLITAKNLLTGSITRDTFSLSCIALPFVAGAIVAGNILLKRLNGAVFVKLVYVMLLISGGLMVMQAL